MWCIHDCENPLFQLGEAAERYRRAGITSVSTVVSDLSTGSVCSPVVVPDTNNRAVPTNALRHVSITGAR